MEIDYFDKVGDRLLRGHVRTVAKENGDTFHFFEGGKLVMSRYLDTAFPFPFYLVLRDLSTLPVVLSDALRGHLASVASSGRSPYEKKRALDGW